MPSPAVGTYATPSSTTARWNALIVVELRATDRARGYMKNETRNDEKAVIEAPYAHLENTLV